ncbi:helix-turn-helix domain-containing protein [Tsukamurella soli]|uniref:HTH cro/C1-type domain-containing protein n=1 Tax=Tsukamurella soli TaxID=644556 RepID=A0ABP8J7L2_9ACTN
MNQTFADALLTGRQAAKLSQRELAERVTALGVKMDSSTLHRMEHGQREPKLSEALALSRLLHFDLSELATGLDATEALTELLTSDAIRAIAALVDVGVATRVLWDATYPSLPDDDERKRKAVEVTAAGVQGAVETGRVEMTTDEWEDYRRGLGVLTIVTEGAGDGSPTAP